MRAVDQELSKIKLDFGNHVLEETQKFEKSVTDENLLKGLPQIAIDAWTEIWNYFSNGKADHQRLYSTDFEYYPNGNR